MADRHPTATRLIDAALGLFAEAGVAGTPIVKIEERAGLAPGSGAFYRHFRSKADLFDAAVADAAAASHGAADYDALAQFPLKVQFQLVARSLWAFYDTHRDLVIVLTREAGHRPARYGHAPDRWPGSGMADIASWLRSLAASGALTLEDPEATALVLIDALTNYWLQRAVEDPTPYGIDEERFLAAWSDLALRLRA